MFKEDDIVVLIEDVLTEGPTSYSNDDIVTLPKGSIGAILSIYKYEDGVSESEYLIEFEENILVFLKKEQLEDIKIYSLKERITKLKKI